jgi:hypothetical protein
VALRIIELVVDPEDDVERAVILDRGGNDDPLHAAVEVGV